ncbi:MAG: alpha/beta hydrolase [Woeseiaceae bacterium]|nr:alpha/beta hydrolase [Woeseiaceae bacterium]
MKRHPALIVVSLLLVTLISCAAAPPIDRDYSEIVGDYETLIELPFITNRKIEISWRDERYFGNTVGGIAGGTCAVGINEGDDDGDLIGVRGGSVLSVFGDLDPEDGIVVYVHGYYEDFERACRRAATLKRRLGVDKGFLLFTWPANSQPLTYRDDEADLEASTPTILKLLDDLGTRFGPERISIIAHSLGSRGAVNSLRDWPVPDRKFRSLVLVAADIDRAMFIESLPELQEHVENITVLVSDRDRALLVSETVNRAPRLGQSDDVAIEGIEIFDVTTIADTHFSGHVYHLRNQEVIDIIRAALAAGGAEKGP